MNTNRKPTGGKWGVLLFLWLSSSAVQAQLTAIVAVEPTARRVGAESGDKAAPAACMGMSPCGAPEASTHPDCAPTRSPARS